MKCCLPTYKVICDRSHSLVCKNNPYYSEVSYGRYNNHPREENAPYNLPPPWKNVHVVARIPVGNDGKKNAFMSIKILLFTGERIHIMKCSSCVSENNNLNSKYYAYNVTSLMLKRIQK